MYRADVKLLGIKLFIAKWLLEDDWARAAVEGTSKLATEGPEPFSNTPYVFLAF